MYKNYPSFEKDFDQDQDKQPSAPKNSYRILSPYIQKPNTLHMCFLDYTPEALQQEDPNLMASQILLQFAHYPVQSMKNRYYFELLLQNNFCEITHKFRGNLEAHQTLYPSQFETPIIYSKIIIKKGY